MKRSFLIIFAILSSVSAIGQTDVNASANQNNNYVALKMYNGDTLGYVQHNFIDNKEKYIGKDLNTLLKDVELPIISFLPSLNELDNKTSPSMYLQFHTTIQDRAMRNSSQKPTNIIIEWAKPLLFDSVFLMYSKTKGDWTEEHQKYFGKNIIRDLMTTKYQ